MLTKPVFNGRPSNLKIKITKVEFSQKNQKNKRLKIFYAIKEAFK